MEKVKLFTKAAAPRLVIIKLTAREEKRALAIAKQAGIKLSGFPGVLLLAVQVGIISPEDLKKRLEICKEKGTHYGVDFIRQVYKMAKR